MYKKRSNEQQIDILHMLYSLLVHWKAIILLAIIGAVIGAGIGWINMPTKDYFIATGELVEKKIPALRTDERRAVDIALGYYEVYANLEKYAQNSILMNSDFNELCEGRVTYSIYGEKKYAEIIGKVYSYVNDESFMEELRKDLEIDSSYEYLSELIAFEESTGLLNEAVTAVAPMDSALFTVVFIYNDREVAQKAVESMTKLVNNYIKSFSYHYSEELEIKKLSGYVSNVVDTKNLTSQTGIYNQLNSALANYKKAVSGFTKEQSDIYLRILQGKPTEPTKYTADEIESRIVFTKDVLIKWIAIGAGGFAFAFCLIYVLAYIISNLVRTVSDVERITERRVYYIKDTNLPKLLTGKIKKLIINRTGNGVSSEYTAKNIAHVTKEKTLVVSLTNKDSDLAEIKKVIADKKDLFELVTGYMAEDVEAYEKANEIKNIWLVVKANETKMNTMLRELDVIDSNDLNLAGVILL